MKCYFPVSLYRNWEYILDIWSCKGTLELTFGEIYVYRSPSILYKRLFFFLLVLFWSFQCEIAFLAYLSDWPLSPISSAPQPIYFLCLSSITRLKIEMHSQKCISHRYGLKSVFICFYFFDADHTPCCPSISVITLHCFLASDLSCYPGWTGNRCHVKEKPFPSTTTPKPEDTQLGNKEAHLPPHL